MPLTFSISDAIGLCILSHAGAKIMIGRERDRCVRRSEKRLSDSSVPAVRNDPHCAAAPAIADVSTDRDHAGAARAVDRLR
jgi:hypothetical protein